MKKTVNIIAIMFIMIASFNLKAQNKTSDVFNYVVLTRKMPQLKPIILVAQNLAEQDEDKFGAFHVVICGKTAKNLTDPAKTSQFIDMAENAGVQLFACGFSLKKFNVNTSKLPDEIQVVQNGILYAFELQKKGYLSIEL